MSREHIHFVTGRLAEQALRAAVVPLAEQFGFDYSLGVMPITVAALMSPAWIARHLAAPPETTRVLLPGYCQGDLEPIRARVAAPVEWGPKDLRQLPEFLGAGARGPADYGRYDVQIIAEINHAQRLGREELRRQAAQLAADGADLIDVGCEPGEPWSGVAEAVQVLRDDGHRVSIDSLQPAEIAPAVKAGAELVLSVNSSNLRAAPDWGCEVVVIPDEPATLAGLDESAGYLAQAGVRFRLDPILEPIGFGFAASLQRYARVRQQHPDAEMLMGIGNLTELTDVDSAGVNVLLLAICQELGIRSVLTTQVISWARTSVRECDVARRLVHYAVQQHLPPKHVDPRLVVLRDPRVHRYGAPYLDDLARQIKDRNYRLFAEDGRLHLIAAGLHLQDQDPFRLFEQLLQTQPRNLDAAHAFYLGYELAKAVTALTLGKEYQQDEALNWGHLTVPETSHRTGKWRAEAE